MRYDEVGPANGHAHRIDVLAHTLRELALQGALPDPQPWEPDGADQDPLSPESLGAQTSRLLKLIERARDQKDVSLLHSLRRELLLTRWALVRSRPAGSRGAAEKRAVPRASLGGENRVSGELEAKMVLGGGAKRPQRPLQDESAVRKAECNDPVLDVFRLQPPKAARRRHPVDAKGEPMSVAIQNPEPQDIG